MIGRLVARGTLAGSAMLFLPVAVASLIAWQALGLAWQGTITHFLIITIAVLALSTFTGNSGVLSFGHAAVHGARRPCHRGADDPGRAEEHLPSRSAAVARRDGDALSGRGD